MLFLFYQILTEKQIFWSWSEGISDCNLNQLINGVFPPWFFLKISGCSLALALVTRESTSLVLYRWWQLDSFLCRTWRSFSGKVKLRCEPANKLKVSAPRSTHSMNQKILVDVSSPTSIKTKKRTTQNAPAIEWYSYLVYIFKYIKITYLKVKFNRSDFKFIF